MANFDELKEKYIQQSKGVKRLKSVISERCFYRFLNSFYNRNKDTVKKINDSSYIFNNTIKIYYESDYATDITLLHVEEYTLRGYFELTFDLKIKGVCDVNWIIDKGNLYSIDSLTEKQYRNHQADFDQLFSEVDKSFNLLDGVYKRDCSLASVKWAVRSLQFGNEFKNLDEVISFAHKVNWMREN